MVGTRLLALIAGVLAMAGLAVAVWIRAPSSSSIEVRLPEATSATPVDGQLKAYITGAVHRPGVYAIRPGDRVADLVEAAGGPTDDADLTIVNFARRIRDEDHVTIPRKGDAASVVVAASGSQRININTAAAATLETLPGIGPTRAQRIVESRMRDGPFLTTADLVTRKLIPQSVYDSIKELVDVQP